MERDFYGFRIEYLLECCFIIIIISLFLLSFFFLYFLYYPFPLCLHLFGFFIAFENILFFIILNRYLILIVYDFNLIDFETLREQLDEKIEYIENVEHSLLEKESHISVQSSRIEELSKKCSEYELKISSIEDEILHLTHSSELAISELTTSKRILEDRICELRQALQEASIEHRTEIALKQEELEVLKFLFLF